LTPAGSPEPLYSFDFGGGATPLQLGYTRVTHDSDIYTPERGYGWLPVPLAVRPAGDPEATARYVDKDVPTALELIERRIDSVAAVTRFNQYPMFASFGGSWEYLVDWTGGFWVGQLWLAYLRTGDAKYLTWAEAWLPELGTHARRNTHDLGFLFYYSYAYAYDITGHDEYRRVALTAADHLVNQMYQPRVGLIATPAFDDTIIDTMMNLQLLWWAYRVTGDERYRDVAVTHAKKSAEWLVRPDGSTYQSVHYDIATGRMTRRHTHQGYADYSTWSRGQSWALYGYAVAYEATGDAEFLETARRTGDYILLRLPPDRVPYVDYDAPPNTRPGSLKDSSAGAIAAAGFLRLAGLEPDAERSAAYRTVAEEMIEALLRDYLSPISDEDPLPPGSLQHGSFNHSGRGANSELIWGNYYLQEALLRLEELQTGKPFPWPGGVAGATGSEEAGAPADRTAVAGARAGIEAGAEADEAVAAALGSVATSLSEVLARRADTPLTGDDYMTVLSRWVAHAERGFVSGYSGLSGAGFFGDGRSGENGMRSLGNFIFTYALLATDSRYDPALGGVNAAHLAERARAALRYMTRTHVTGDLVAADGERWGHHWQSSWWASKMAAGAALLWSHLAPEERAAVERVVADEANRHLIRTPPSGAQSDTKAEENAWDAEILAWASVLFPDRPEADAWRRKLTEFTVNALSTFADWSDGTLVDGRPVSEWSGTANVLSDFTIHNHGAYHAGYMAWPLASLTWVYYAFAQADRPVPQGALHRYGDVWNALRRTYIGDGRFAYLGGKDWPRYTYGLYAIIPATVLVHHYTGDPLARIVEAERVRTLAWEQEKWGDGSFFGGRFSGGNLVGWSAEFESDAAALLGLAYRLRELLASNPERGEFPTFGTVDADHPLAGPQPVAVYSPGSEFVFAYDDGFYTAFSWRTLSRKDVMGVVFYGDPQLAEWAPGQLAGGVEINGAAPDNRGVAWHDTKVLPGGGFATLGRVWYGGVAGSPDVEQDLAVVSLPAARRLVLLEQVRTRRTVRITNHWGLDFHIPNDIFNGNRRDVFYAGGRVSVAAGETQASYRLGEGWANVDGRLGVVVRTDGGSLVLETFRDRNEPRWRSLRSERLRWYPDAPGETYLRNQAVRRAVYLFHAGDADETARLAMGGVLMIPVEDGDILAAVVSLAAGGAGLPARAETAGAGSESRGEALGSGSAVLVMANFGLQAKRVAVAVPGGVADVVVEAVVPGRQVLLIDL